MKFRVTIKVAGEAIYHAVHEADGSEPALRAAMQAARRACPGKPVYLCWKLGEPEVLFWHDLDAGFRGRQPLTAGSSLNEGSLSGGSLDSGAAEGPDFDAK